MGFSGPKAGSRTYAAPPPWRHWAHTDVRCGTSATLKPCPLSSPQTAASVAASCDSSCRYVELLHVCGLSQCIVGEEDAHWCDVVKSYEALSLFQQFESRHRWGGWRVTCDL